LNGTLLVGGFASDTQFIASIGRHYDGQTLKTVCTEPGGLLTLCVDQIAAGDFFDSKLTQELDVLTQPRTLEDEIKAGIKCAASTIRLMEQQDKFTGGTIRCAIIKPSKPLSTIVYQG
jgi:hypothetical protein